ncbi:MAG: PhzF family phenazine biosynthesis protein [Dehalococcoidia bacterium]|nr:PhzF family phenazine biosynthesis protein [Dehalococcoidia bacterium]
MSIHRIRHVDAFTSTPLTGNPAAVIDGAGIDETLLQPIARNQNLSETVFLLPPEDAADDARVRIFTPRSELPFAGHPIIAAAHIVIEEQLASPARGAPLRIETGVGVIPVAVDDAASRYTMTQPRPQFREASTAAGTVAAAIGLRTAEIARVVEVSTGIWWLVAQAASLEAMRRVRPDVGLLRSLQVAIFCIGAESAEADVHVRVFALPQGISEDPVTGSANGCIGALIARDALLDRRDGALRYVAEQGIELGQPGRVCVCVRDSGDQMSVEVGGEAVTVLRGELTLA